MKKLIGFILIELFVSGCGAARMKITKFDKEGNVKSVNKISYIRVGSGELNKVKVNLKTGKVEIGSQKGSAGDIAEALKNFSEVAKKASGIP